MRSRIDDPLHSRSSICGCRSIRPSAFATPASAAPTTSSSVAGTWRTCDQPRITEAGAGSVSADAEWFWPRGNPDERCASKERLRAGCGWRRSPRWHYEALDVLDRSRDAAKHGFVTSDNALDLKVVRVW